MPKTLKKLPLLVLIFSLFTMDALAAKKGPGLSYGDVTKHLDQYFSESMSDIDDGQRCVLKRSKNERVVLRLFGEPEDVIKTDVIIVPDQKGSHETDQETAGILERFIKNTLPRCPDCLEMIPKTIGEMQSKNISETILIKGDRKISIVHSGWLSEVVIVRVEKS